VRLAVLVLAAHAAHAAHADKLALIQEKLAEKLAPTDPAADAALTKLVEQPTPPIVNLHNIWTGETLVIPVDKAVVDQDTMDGFLRDHFTNLRTHIDLRLVGVLTGAAAKFKTLKIDIVSGFRSPKFNLMLRKHMHEVARDSQHSHGHAVDFRIAGVATETLLSYVRSLRLGGAGYYPISEFVHADTGPIRTWEGR
jgi:uncharacterized protein YcbK (DUF882 family)